MEKLTERQFWDRRHEGFVQDSPDGGGKVLDRLRRNLARARSAVGAEPGDSYTEHQYWKVLRRYLPCRSDWSIIEIGCAPGRQVLRFHKTFGYQPYGIEYSPVGAESTRRAFAARGQDTSHVIEDDLFSEEFQSRHCARFDLVYSRGFIEHFRDPSQVIEAHLNLLKPGGYLICDVPNLRNLSHPLLFTFAPDVLKSHNTQIMRLRPFEQLFARCGVIREFCGFVGLFHVYGASLRFERFPLRLVGKSVEYFGDGVSALMFLTLRGRTWENSWSPFLLFVGRKAETA